MGQLGKVGAEFGLFAAACQVGEHIADSDSSPPHARLTKPDLRISAYAVEQDHAGQDTQPGPADKASRTGFQMVVSVFRSQAPKSIGRVMSLPRLMPLRASTSDSAPGAAPPAGSNSHR